jgi:UDP-glucose 4-epimerase
MEENNFFGKNALITGGLGLTGSNLARRLVEYGANVSLYNSTLTNEKNVADIRDKVDIIVGDISDYEKVESAILDRDIVFHLAGQSSVSDSMAFPYLDLNVNCKGTLNVLESCKEYNGLAKIVFAGTVREVGPMIGHVKEDQRENPVSIFDLHKLTCEKYMEIYHKIYGMATTTLRFSNIYGEGQFYTDPDRNVINHYVKKALSDRVLNVYGDGGPLRDYNHVSNIVDACLNAASSDYTNGKYYVLGSGESKTFKNFIDILQKILKEEHSIEIEINKVDMPNVIAKTVQGNVIVDSSRFEEDTGWRPKINFEEGLRRVLDFYKNQI